MNITIVAESYPSKNDPAFPFVQQLAYALSNEQNNVSVIAPQSITKSLFRKLPIKPFFTKDISPEGKIINIIRPRYMTFSNSKNSFLLKFSRFLLKRAIKKGIHSINKIDAIYCYFWHIGLTTACVSGNIPLFVQASECEITVDKELINDENINKVYGVVCASVKNKVESINAGLTDESKCTVIVNGYRPDQFFAKNKKEARSKFGYLESAFIVSFVGGFIERKGIDELSTALSRFNDVYSIFIGRGNHSPVCDHILFCGVVEHDKIVDYLNCADIFVLPTKAEGCCNAIIEALACGLPVISSNKSFNDDILDETCSIRVNEESVEEIYKAIKELKNNDDLLMNLSKGALIKASSLSIDKRGKAVSEFIKSKLS